MKPKSTTTPGILHLISDALGRGISAVAGGFDAAAEARVRRIAMLNAKTDAQLAAMKLRRADIPNHVFQDLFYS